MGRLEKIVELVDEKKIIADIGSDHGITAIKIYEERNPKKVIATDISKNSIQKLVDKLHYNKYNIETMIADGIKELPEDVEQIIISGMGGILISNIIEEGIDIAKNAEKLIIQANNSLVHLREYLLSNSFEIVDEYMIEDSDIIYFIIISRFDEKSKNKEYSDIELKYGRHNIKRKDELLIEYIEKEVDNINTIISNIKDINTKDSIKRLEEIKMQLKVLEDLLCKLKN